MAQSKSRPRLIWKILNNAPGRRSKNMDLKQLIDVNDINWIVTGNNNIVEKFNNYFVNNGNTYSEKLSDSFAFKDYRNTTSVGEPGKFLPVNL